MLRNRGFIVGRNALTIKTLVEKFSHRAFAEETDPQGDKSSDDGDNKPTPPVVNYEDLISKARKEEKAKQYAKIQKLEGQINVLTKQHNDDLVVVAGLKEQLEEANRKLTTASSGDSEEVQTLKNSVKTLEKANKELEEKLKAFTDNPPPTREQIEQEVRAELEAEYEVKNYRTQLLAENKDKLLVPELVTGDTKEALDESFKQAIQRSDEIRKSLGVQNTTSKNTKKKGTPKSPTSPSVSTTLDEEYSAEYLASLDVSSPEYAEVRKKLGLR